MRDIRESRLFIMYEKAVEGRNLHYQQYSTWMNCYAMFTGAFFVGFYTLRDNPLLSLLIAVLGYITSICWYYSLSGYYAWMVSWIELVHRYEEELKSRYGTGYVYSYAGKILFKEEGFPQNFSTQRITRVFIMAVIAGWLIIASAMITKCGYALIERVLWWYALPCIGILLFMVNGGLLIALSVLIRSYFRYRCRSSITNMKKDMWK